LAFSKSVPFVSAGTETSHLGQLTPFLSQLLCAKQSLERSLTARLDISRFGKRIPKDQEVVSGLVSRFWNRGHLEHPDTDQEHRQKRHHDLFRVRQEYPRWRKDVPKVEEFVPNQKNSETFNSEFKFNPAIAVKVLNQQKKVCFLQKKNVCFFKKHFNPKRTLLQILVTLKSENYC
jgi:hypothetical protein